MELKDYPARITASSGVICTSSEHRVELLQVRHDDGGEHPAIEVYERHGDSIHRSRWAISTVVHVLLNITEEEWTVIESRSP